MRRRSGTGSTRRHIGGFALLAPAVLAVAGCGSTASSPPPSTAGSGPSAPSTTPATTPGRAGTVIARFAMPADHTTLEVTRQHHPRGGTQLHLYAVPGSTELTTGSGQPLLPFMATDTRPTTHTASSCAQGRLVVTVATAAQRLGRAAAWDIRRTTYRVIDGHAQPLDTTDVADGVPARDLTRRYPALARDTLLAGCTRLPG